MSTDIVRRTATTVILNGVTRAVDSVSIDRDIATSLPATVTGGGGIEKATATVTLDEPDTDVVVERTSPWAPRDGWPPQRSQPVTVDTTLNDEAASRRFTGRVQSVTGSVGEPVSVQLEDAMDDLQVQVSHEPLLRTMMPLRYTGSSPRVIGLSADYLANHIFRRAGFSCTPAKAGTVRVSVPAQGSMWPETGMCEDSTSTDPGTIFPAFHPAPWGWSVGGVSATYPNPNGGRMFDHGGSIFLAMMAAPDHAGAARINAHLEHSSGSRRRVTLRVTSPGRAVQLLVDDVVVTTQTPPDGWWRIMVSHDGNEFRMRTDTGWEHVQAHTLPVGTRTLAWSDAEVIADPQARVAGFMAGFATLFGNSYISSDLNARIRTSGILSHMQAMPTIDSRDGLDLLREISAALSCALWIDRDGVLQWAHPDALRTQQPAATLTADADLLDLAWEDTSDSARRSVTVKYRQATITRRNLARITVWEGSSETLEQGESVEQIITPPSDQDWIDVDTGPRQLLLLAGTSSNPDNVSSFNAGIGSWVGGTPLNSEGDSAPAKQQAYNDDSGGDESFKDHGYPSMTYQMEKIGPAAWKITQTLNNIGDNYWIDLTHKLDIPDSLRYPVGARWNGQNLPIVRARGLTQWTDTDHTSGATGPAGYEHLTHDAGVWVGAAAEAFSFWIARQVIDPAPVLRDLPILYRTDVDLGQVIDVVEDVVHHVRLRVLVIAIKEDHTEGDSELRLTCRVISAEPTRYTYDDQAAQWAGRTYDALATAGGTYDSREDA